MGVEILIYCYGAICASMILFNCICIIVFQRSNRKLDKKSRDLSKRIEAQIVRLQEGKPMEDTHRRYLCRRLVRVGNLMAFDRSLNQCYAADGETAQRYLCEIHPVLIHLSLEYLKKENMQSAYLVYLLTKYNVCKYLPLAAITDLLKEYLKKDSLYCRQNALKAFYNSGCEENVVEALLILEREGVFLHIKILADGLLTFEGNHSKLIASLWESFDLFSVNTKVAILNYIRFQSGDYCEKMFELLTDPAQDKELIFAAIRYFGKYQYLPAYPVLLKYARDTDELNWNYAAFSAAALAGYPGSETADTLKKSLGSSNWYVRYNASQSLNRLDLSYHDLSDVINGDDRYAREIIQYQIDSRHLEHSEKEYAI